LKYFSFLFQKIIDFARKKFKKIAGVQIFTQEKSQGLYLTH
jgi:hypothetical protein